MNYARLNGLDVRISRLDLAFDIFNRPEIVFLQHIKQGYQAIKREDLSILPFHFPTLIS